MDHKIVFEMQLAKFVDGEMSSADEDRFLALCESDPAGYRDLALMFVEQRCWRTQLSNALPDERTRLKTKASISGSQKRVCAALAATLLMGLFAGYGWATRQNKIILNEMERVAMINETKPSPTPPSSPTPSEDEIPSAKETSPIVTIFYPADDNFHRLPRTSEWPSITSAAGRQSLMEARSRIEAIAKLQVRESPDSPKIVRITRSIRFPSN